MSRRKQARPVRLLDEDGVLMPSSEQTPAEIDTFEPSPPSLQQDAHSNKCGGESSNSCSEEELISGGAAGGLPTETHMCPRCHEQFTDMGEFIAHRTECDNKARLHHEPAHSDPEDMVVSGDEDEEECGGKRLEQVRRHRQDAANNNSVEESGQSTTEGGETPLEFPPFPVPAAAAAGHVTLEALQNTKVAVAQFAATAMANNADNEAALQELAVLQSTLFTLQHQQVFQLQLINQLQQQLSINRPKEDASPASPPSTAEPEQPQPPPEPAPQPTPSPPQNAPRLPPTREPTPVPKAVTPIAPTSQALPPTQPQVKKEPIIPPVIIPVTTATLPSPPPSAPTQPPLCSISSSLASTIITNNDPPPSLDEPNTLEMLQRRAQEVLDNASQGLLASNLADELAFRKGKGSMSPYDSKSGRNEPFFKHRCRYCGKVFGSDSALQIHIRSHTGERPFKCNVCGSRFTTKGNLKVHFQRHTSKFPHIKMNPNPVPEHLDKYHPPLLAQLGQNRPLSPGGLPPHPHHPLSFPAPHPFPLYRPPPGPHDLLPPRPLTSPQRPPEGPLRAIPPHPIFLRREEQEMPENLSKPARSPSPPPREILENRCKSEPIEENNPPPRRDSEARSEDVNALTPKQEPTDTEQEQEGEMPTERYNTSPAPYDDCSMDSKYSNEETLGPESPMEHDDQLQDQPENLSSKSQTSSITIPLSIATAQRLPASFPFSHTGSPPSSTSSGSLGTFPIPPPGTDPARDPAIYANLLPRPGSNDNSWESLIEVTKTSETSKLQQLVDNIEHKLTDPNQCVICHRVLSCKSALQMHYRTHTGERPFKCKICGRAFTTKGNLKTHMGVHRAKPPMRVLHQCPVCHKKFTNALVLQQHIRLHTGEPTDLTPEQIQAAEIKDFPSPGGFPLHNSLNPFLTQGFPPIPGLSPLGPPGFPLGLKPNDFDFKDDHHDFMEEDEDDDDESSTTTEQHIPTFSTSLAALENQVRTITTMASQLSAGFDHRSNDDLCSNSSRMITSTPTHQNGEKSPENHSEMASPSGSEVRGVTSPSASSNARPPSSQRAVSPSPSESNSLGALDLTPRSSQLPLQPSPGLSPGPPPPPGIFTNFGLLPPAPVSTPLMTSALSSLTSSVLTSTAFSPLGLAVGPAVRGNTTCNICFKTFACNSALEIHYRSHTKERPFKCTVCDRGFSTKGNNETCKCSPGQRRIQEDGGGGGSQKSKPKRIRKRSNDKTSSDSSTAPKMKYSLALPPRLPPPPALIDPGYATASEWNTFLLGNMKQHMLTHKIRDMPQHMFDKPGGGVIPQQIPPPPTSLLQPPSLKDTIEASRNHSLSMENSMNSNDSEVSSQQQSHHQHQQQSLHIPNQPNQQLPLPPPEMPIKADITVKRSPTEAELPLAKRPPSGIQAPPPPPPQTAQPPQQVPAAAGAITNTKHLCHVCNKNFSSSSALQIHMRTHTGDKPFRCTVCQKAFTTKGNLKVHMGTHMWSNGASRRGRRMSLDLPPIPMTPKDSEFLQRRPDLFYPYLPAPFLNGMQQKLNEISVIQNPGNGLPSPSKYASLLGFGYPPSEPLRSQPSSPLSDKPPSSVPSSPPRESTERSSGGGGPTPRDVLPRVWDLHYERATTDEEVSPPNGGINVPNPNQLTVPPSARGEGLAA